MTLSAAAPSNVAGRKAYTVTASPKEKGGLLDSVQIAWDAARGVPLRAAVYAKGTSSRSSRWRRRASASAPCPTATSTSSLRRAREPCSFPDPVAAKRQAATRAEESAAARLPGPGPRSRRSGFRARRVQSSVRPEPALVVYGEGLGTIVVAEHKAAPTAAQLKALPTVPLDGATGHELSTPLGTILTWRRGDVTYVLAGSIPAATARRQQTA